MPPGLSDYEVAQSRQLSGFNLLPQPKGPSLWQLFLSQFQSLFVALLLFAASLALISQEYLDAAFIFAVTVVNALIGFLQEAKAKKELAALKKLLTPFARVIRNGVETAIATKDLVPKDIVLLSPGDHVPADGQIITGKNLTVNQAALTGESAPVEKAPRDFVFAGTTVLSGRAVVRLTQIGAQTRFGTIAQTLAATAEEPTPLNQKLATFTKKLAVTVVLLTLLIAAISLLQNRSLKDVFFLTIALFVAAIPEGLPAVLTVTVAIGSQRLSKRNTIVKRLVAIETLGTIDVILTDKTGTLTQNAMAVREIITRSLTRYRLSDNPTDHLNTADPQVKKILQIAVLCNTSSLVSKKDGANEFSVLGDTTEGSLLVLAKNSGLSPEDLRRQNPISEELPFDSQRKMMTVLVKNEILAKGAPEVIISKSKNLLAKEKATFREETEKLAQKGYRVLAFATKPAPSKIKKTAFEKDLNFAGLAAIWDPPRPQAAQAIKASQDAGIATVMITGDSPTTARTIGTTLGLLAKDDAVVTSDQLALYSDDLLKTKLERIKIFARATPEDKLRIVNSYQQAGKIVAVTGDGINDAPALKKAHVGVAMGKTGTDVAKEAADVVILDDNFATIVAAIEEGRTIFVNLTTAIKFLLACNFGEIIIVAGSVILNLPLPFSPLALLWLNMVTDTLPALSLAANPKRATILSPAQQRDTDFLAAPNLTKVLLWAAVIGGGSLTFYLILLAFNSAHARIAVFSLLVFFELALAFLLTNHPPLKNRWLVATAVLVIALQTTIIALPVTRNLLFP